MNYKGEIPFVRLLIPLMAGIVTAWYFPDLCVVQCVVLVLFTLIFLLFSTLIFYRRFKLYRFRGIWGLLIILIIFLSAYMHAIFQSGLNRLDDFSKHRSNYLIISIANEPISRGDIVRFEGQVKFAGTQKVTGKLLLAVKVDSSYQINHQYGDLLLIPSQYHEIEPPYNPAEFNFRAYLKTHHIRYQSFINQRQIIKLGSGYGNPMLAFALSLRGKIVDHFRQHIPDPAAAAFASTLIMGYRADLSPEVLDAYSKTGTMHVLSVSGMHVALVFLLLNFLFMPLEQLKQLRFLKPLLLIAMIWFYAMLSGFSAPVNRAAMMLSFVVIGKASSKSINTYNLLAASAFILLIVHPYYVMDIGFQLSYLAVLGLVFFQPPIANLLYFKTKISGWIWNYVALSLAAQLFTFPLSMLIFHQFPLSFLVSNLLIVLPVSLLMYLGLFFVMLMPLGIGLSYVGQGLFYLIHFTNQSLFFIGKLPYASLQGIAISHFQTVLLYVAIIALVGLIMYKRKWGLWLLVVCFILVFAERSVSHFKLASQHKIIFYSLRKNFAMAYFKGNRYDLITDLKAGEKAEQFSVSPFLNRMIFIQRNRLSPNDIIYADDICSNGKLMQLGSYRLLRWTADENNKTYSSPLKVNAVLLTGNPSIKLSKLKEMIQFRQLLIDATNPDYKIRKWLAEAKSLQIPVYVLKKNPYLEVDLSVL